MLLKLQFASLLTLGMLSGMVLAIILAIMYIGGYIWWPLVIAIIIVFNLLAWLVGPYISDLIYKWFYNIQFYEYDQIKDIKYIRFMKTVCDQHKIRLPKIGIIKDMNPTAFTYGSAAFNARVVFSEGLLKFLNEKEVEAVLAHELGHIIHKDFIVMTIASILLQILYEMYVIFARSRTQSSGLGKKGEKKGGAGALIAIGYVSLLFYWIGTYLLLYLSRTREYYADAFAAEKTGDANLLSSALVKIAYGIAIVPDTTKASHLLHNTRALGIFDINAASEVGLVYENAGRKMHLMEKALLFDIVNPWAKLLELKSTHPLVGKRIKALCKASSSPAFNFEKIEHEEVDKGRLWKNFFKDVGVVYSTRLVVLFFILALVYQFLSKNVRILETSFVFLILMTIFSVIKVRYRYPKGGFRETDIIHLMSDIYASPVKGNPVILNGNAIGRGVAGAIFGEDMMFRDKTGLIYLNYESGLPFLGNLIFAWKKLEKLLNKPATVTGWFLRGATHHLELDKFRTHEDTITSYVRFWYIFGVVLGMILLIMIIVWVVGLQAI